MIHARIACPVLLSIILAGCGPQLRASWHLADVDAGGQKDERRVFLTLTNLDPAPVELRHITVNGRPIPCVGDALLNLAPGEVTVINLGMFGCELPLVVEFRNLMPWRHKVRGVSWTPSAAPDQIETDCRWDRGRHSGSGPAVCAGGSAR